MEEGRQGKGHHRMGDQGDQGDQVHRRRMVRSTAEARQVRAETRDGH